MIESKSVKCGTWEENSVINEWQSFGWTLKSSQEVNNIDNHLENRGGTIYQVREKESYVKLTFDRDTTIPNYKEICAIECEYDRFHEFQKQDVPGIGFLWFICLIPPLTPVGIILLVVKLKKKSKAQKANEGIDAKNSQIRSQKSDLRAKARALLNK